MSIRTTEIKKLGSKRTKYQYRYFLENHLNQTIYKTNDFNFARSEALARNLRLLKRLPQIRIGKKVYRRDKIIHEIDKTKQLTMEFL